MSRTEMESEMSKWISQLPSLAKDLHDAQMASNWSLVRHYANRVWVAQKHIDDIAQALEGK